MKEYNGNFHKGMLVYAVAEWQFSLLCVIINSKSNNNNKRQANSSKCHQCKGHSEHPCWAMHHSPFAMQQLLLFSPLAFPPFFLCSTAAVGPWLWLLLSAFHLAGRREFHPATQPLTQPLTQTRVAEPFAHLLAFLIWLSAALKSLPPSGPLSLTLPRSSCLLN